MTDRASGCGPNIQTMSGPTTSSRIALTRARNTHAQHHRRVHARMSGDPCEPKAEIHGCHRRALRPVHPARRPRAHSFRQWPGVRRQGRAGMDYGAVGAKTAYIAPGSPWENGYYRKLQRAGCATSCSMAKSSTRSTRPEIVIESWRRHYNRASEHPSVYVIEGKRLCWLGCDPVGYFGFCRARSVMDRAADVVRAARAKIQGPSGKGWMASISPVSAASLRVFGAICMSRAALLRLSQGSFPSSAGLCTGMR